MADVRNRRGVRPSTRGTQRERCLSCGCILAADHDNRLCSPCRAREPYDPRTDGDFAAKLAAYLGRHIGGDCDPYRHFGIIPAAHYVVSRQIARLNREGWRIITRHGGPRGGGCHVARRPPDVSA